MVNKIIRWRNITWRGGKGVQDKMIKEVKGDERILKIVDDSDKKHESHCWGIVKRDREECLSRFPSRLEGKEAYIVAAYSDKILRNKINLKIMF